MKKSKPEAKEEDVVRSNGGIEIERLGCEVKETNSGDDVKVGVVGVR